MKRSIPINREQLKALNSVLRLEILTSLTSHGSGTARDLAGRLRVDEHRLYYHLKKLAAVGLVLIEGSRKTATKPESIFSVAGYIWVGGFDFTDPALAAELDRHFGLVLKMAAREYSDAMTSLDQSIGKEAIIIRGVGKMNAQRREEFRQKLRDLNSWVISLDDSDGEQCACTFSFQPLVDRKPRTHKRSAS